MRLPYRPFALAGAAMTLALTTALTAGPADAYICYFVLNAGDAVVYRGTMPPVDMSAHGAAAREALRARGDYLLIMDTDDCLPEGSALGAAGPGQTTPADFIGGARRFGTPR